MPIDRNSDAWEEGNESPMVEAVVVDILSSHPDRAFSLRELANEVGLADWDKAKQWSEDHQEMEQKEFQEKYPVGGDHPTPQTESHGTRELYLIIRRLAQMGVIGIRAVDADAVNTDYLMAHEEPEEITTIAYTADR